MQWPLLATSDLTALDVAHTLSLAASFRDGASVAPSGTRTVGLVFFEASLRTRVGFCAAATRLGAGTVEVYEPRASAVSMPESWSDTIRTVAGYVNAIVARPGRDVDRADTRIDFVPYINGGDHGAEAEHPTQALVDLFAIRVLGGGHVETVVILGDPTMRAARSLISLLLRETVQVLVVTDDYFQHGVPAGARRVEISEILDTTDVLYVTGMRHDSLPLSKRAELLLTEEVLAQLPSSSLVLSPMPLIDEIDERARLDPRVRVFDQSDLGLYVRMAVLAQALELEMVGQ